MQPYYVKTRFQPEFEFADAKRLCAELGAEMRVIHADILAVDEVRANPANRCYFCKRAIFSRILSAAQADGFSLVIDGTNASDDASDRPGMRALREHAGALAAARGGADQGGDPRGLRVEAGLFTWDKPAYACLATRIPAGTALDAETLAHVERAEDALRAHGLFRSAGARVRRRGADSAARGAAARRPLLAASEILEALKDDFSAILLDLKAR